MRFWRARRPPSFDKPALRVGQNPLASEIDHLGVTRHQFGKCLGVAVVAPPVQQCSVQRVHCPSAVPWLRYVPHSTYITILEGIWAKVFWGRTISMWLGSSPHQQPPTAPTRKPEMYQAIRCPPVKYPFNQLRTLRDKKLICVFGRRRKRGPDFFVRIFGGVCRRRWFSAANVGGPYPY